jgi:tryptophan synthase alpha chain
VNNENRIARRFAALKAADRAALIAFVTAGDPDFETSMALVRRLPSAGADVIELGMPFSDPMADGPTIQASSQRALKAGQTMARTLAMVEDLRRVDHETPIVLMGYYNPVYVFGVDRFSADARRAGVDGLLIVDLPPEEDEELRIPAGAACIELIHLVAPTTDEGRLERILEHAGGFLYYVSVTGITGTTSAATGDVTQAVRRLKSRASLPVAVGFGIKTPEQAADVAVAADAAVVGSAIVGRIAEALGAGGVAGPAVVENVAAFVSMVAERVRRARLAPCPG